MNKVYFKNNGVIDITSVTTFGVNAKETDNPFGFFGTGLKYAISILLRESQKITIYAGLDKYEFTTVKKTIRNKEFDVVCMNDAELGFTLELGKNWKLWQAYRELYCNTIDESGVITDIKNEANESDTLITVEGDGFFNIHQNKADIVLGSDPFFSGNGVDIHLDGGRSMYMKGIRVADLPQHCMYTYNFTKPIELTEDRTIKESFRADQVIRNELISGENVDFIKAFVTAPVDTYEQKLDCEGWGIYPSKTFLKTMKSINFKNITNYSALSLYKKHTNTNKSPRPAVMTKVEKIQLSKSVEFCKVIGYDTKEYKINVTDDLNENCLGMAYEGEIYLSRRTFQQGTKQVAATLLEEHLHLDKGFNDETYKFQTYLFDVIMTLGEQLNGEPL